MGRMKEVPAQSVHIVSVTGDEIRPMKAISSGTATIPMYQRYNSTQTGTINNSYTARVYGLKLYDLIGG